jgi:hypothetical protein
LVKGHCRKNPSNKDILEIDEIQEISSVFISMLKKEDLPIIQNLGFGGDGRKYDELIGLGCFGWEGCEDPRLVEKDYYTNIYE